MQDDADSELRPSRRAAAVLDNYFYSTTVILGAAAWIVAFAAQIAVTKIVGRSAVGVLWFAIFLQLFLTFGVLVIFAAGTVAIFRLQVCAFATMGAVFAVIGVDMSIFSGQPARDAMGVGWLVLAIIDILWVLYFSAEPGTPVALLVDRMVVARRAPSGRDNAGADAEKTSPQLRSRTSGYDPEMRSDESPDETKVGHDRQDLESSPTGKPHSSNGYGWGVGDRRIVDRSQENLDEADLQMEREDAHHVLDGGLRPSPSSRARSPPSVSQNRRGVHIQEPQSQHLSTIYDASVSQGTPSDSQQQQHDPYPYKIRARGDWIPRSPSEVSFRKGDILHSSETEGKKWWRVRKADGSVGAAPSNYFRVMNQ